MRLLLVEDDPKLADLISEGLGDEGFVVEHSASATQAHAMASLQPYDLIVLDVMLPEGNNAGFELAKTLREEKMATPILFLTARGDVDSRLTGFEGGGDDYLAKPFDFRELRARIHALIRRSSGQASNVIPLPLGYALHLSAHELSKDSNKINLTPREYTLLECFALHPERAYTRNELIERVWPEESDVELKVVDVFVSTVRRKLGENIIETVRGVGYRLGRLESLNP
jgi:DNA-binding response OmpR family regulator